MNTDFMSIVPANVVFTNIVFTSFDFMNVVFMNIDLIKIAEIIITIYNDNTASTIIYFININLLINI